MHLIVYTSVYSYDSEQIDKDLASICASAQANNPSTGITGMLFYHGKRFLQIIEGEKPALNTLMERLAQDPRHSQIERLIDEPVIKRRLGQWNMETLNLSKDEKLTEQELTMIRDAYTNNLVVDTQVVSDFYRAMLNSRALASAS